MAKILEMPKLSPTMEEGVLSAWHKKEGDAIAIDDLLADVETDKATMEFRSFDKGTLLKLLVPPGALVKLGQPVAVVGAAGEDVSSFVAQPAEGAKAVEGPGKGAASSESPPTRPEEKKPAAQAAPQAAPVEAKPTRQDPTPLSPPTAPPPAMRSPRVGSPLDRAEHERAPAPVRGKSGDRVLASPYVRKMAREMGIDLEGAEGSGPSGRIAAKDVERIRDNGARALTRAPAFAAPVVSSAMTLPSPPPPLQGPEVRPLSMMRKTIARRLTESKQTVPHFYLSIDVDADEIVRLRERINEELLAAGSSRPTRKSNGEEKAPPDKISINDLVVKASAIALTRVPECNAQFSPEAILVFKRVDISVAVAVPDGLVTPVVRNADAKSVVGIAREIRELAGRARSKKLLPEEMANGTFSISNLGMFGIDSFAAVINPPEGAILAVGQVRDEPVVRDGRVVAGKKLALTLSCDHRVVDGAVGAAFLAELRALLERPMRVLTG